MFLKEYGPMAASLVLSATPIIVFYLALQKYIVKGIAAGAIKG
jgi:raffinose/stachyose/melibiose transport system permease protein